ISAMDSLTFDYRLTTYESGGQDPYSPGENDIIRILISEDCGANFTPVFEINSNNHIEQSGMRTIRLPLTANTGKSILIKIEAVWGDGDYWLDLDHVGVFGCPADLGLSFEVIGVSSSSKNDGKIVLNPSMGTPPYNFLWNNGSNSKNQVELGAGVYSVFVRDFFGCEDSGQVNVGLASSIRQLEGVKTFSVIPNPSSGDVLVEIEFDVEKLVEMIIHSSFGQVVERYPVESILRKRIEVNLGNLNSGIYHVSLRTEEGIVTKRLVLIKN
ncbi:MAG: T9SS type A sorting domain-containing protein, partial [Minisyncoccia bacterium]